MGSTRGESIGVFGAGWVGLTTAACVADLGHPVVVHDINTRRVDELRRGRVPIHEPGLHELLARNRARLTYTREAGEVFGSARLVFVCVGTPPLYSGDADLSGVWQVVDELAERREEIVLVMKSTVPVGTGQRVRSHLDELGLGRIAYVSNPEFLAEGTAVANFTNPDRIVIGAFDDAAADAVARLYAPIEAPLVRTDVPSAEMIKLASNAFLATRVSFINEIANVCEMTGADVAEVARGMALDPRLGPHFLRAGIGYGGSCFPKDVAALKQLAGNAGYHFQLLTSVIEVNELQKRRVIAKLMRHLGRLQGKTVVLLGLAFKPGTNDLREAPSLVLASRLLAEGALVRAWDAVALENAANALDGVELFDDVAQALADADAAVIVTEWPELRGLASPENRACMRTPLIVDGRNLLDPELVRSAGFVYEAVGRPPAEAESSVVAATGVTIPA
jgi:UDPglucose 6-dehydrogenase